ncbi:hypothetical protein ACLI4Z_10730 [Natrialbaceae archaeon A-arb3/5]
MSAIGRGWTLLVVLLLVTSTGSIGVAGASGTPSDPLPGDRFDEVDVTADADEVYVGDDGSAVLVYEHPHEGTTVDGEFGIETDPGIVYTNYRGDVAEDDRGVGGELTVESTQGTIASSGDLLVADPSPVTDFEATIDSRQTATEWGSNGDVRLTVADHEPTYSSMQTDGSLEITPDSITSSGTLSVTETDSEAERAGIDSLELTAVETDGGYALEVSERRLVGEWETDRWDTRDDARQSLDNRFSSVAIGLGGTADGSLESYDFTEDGSGAIVEYEYDVEYAGVTDQVAELAVSQVRENAETGLGDTEAQAIADRIASAHVEELSITVDRDGARTDLEWELTADAADELVLGTVEIADSLEGVDDELAEQVDEIRETLAARAATDLQQTASWNVSIEETGDLTAIDATWSTDAENWQAYTAALDDRGLSSVIPDRTTTVNAVPTDDGLDIEYEYETSDDDPVEWPHDRIGDVVPEPIDDVLAELDAIAQTTDLAKMDVVIENGSYELEGAATDPNGTIDAFSVGIDDELAVSELHVATSDGTSTVYVVVTEFVDAEPTDAAVRDREQVGTDTTVAMPGEWDRTFPSIDQERVETLLETDLDANDDADGTALGELVTAAAVPVFVGVLAALALAAYAVRRSSLGRS